MKRIILGNRGSDNALWISKPGKDASSANDDDMMVSPSRFLVQPYLQGRIVNNGTSKVSLVVNHNLGYIPVVEIFGYYSTSNPVQALVTTSTITFNLSGAADNSYHFSGQGAPAGTFYYACDFTYLVFRTQVAAS